MLRLNIISPFFEFQSMTYSNTTNVKVKPKTSWHRLTSVTDSNTTNVKVKLNSKSITAIYFFIQIQPMLRLNCIAPTCVYTAMSNSNTTNVKVKLSRHISLHNLYRYSNTTNVKVKQQKISLEDLQ